MHHRQTDDGAADELRRAAANRLDQWTRMKASVVQDDQQCSRQDRGQQLYIPPNNPPKRDTDERSSYP